MPFEMQRPGFSVLVESGFVDRDAWLIHGVVEYRPSPVAEAARDLVAEAQIELLREIARESRSARARGARSIYVVVDGDDDVAGFFRYRGAPAAG